LPQAEELKTRG